MKCKEGGHAGSRTVCLQCPVASIMDRPKEVAMFERTLGRSSLVVQAMGFGCWAIGGPWTFEGYQAGWGQINDDESIAAVRTAVDMGINFFDTAANYGCGHSERILGRALADRRDQVVIATKFGYRVDEETLNVTHYGDSKNDEVLRRLNEDCETSLRRLNTDIIDLYQFHVGDYDPSSAARVRDALEELVHQGKIRFYGWSTDNPQGAQVFAEGEHCIASQHRLNILQDAPVMLNICDEHNLASVNRGPLGRGLLTGKYNLDSTFPHNDLRHTQTFRNEWIVPFLDHLDRLRDILRSGGRTLVQGALAWIWARSSRTIPIPGIKSVEQLQENAAAMDFGPLNQEDMSIIEELLERA